MKFENAIVAMRKGFKVCRQKNLNRLNGVYYMINKKTGELEVGQMRTGTVRREPDCVQIDHKNITAEDWIVYTRGNA